MLTVLILELAVRLAGETDADGQFTVHGYSLPPYALPLSQLRPQVEAYLAAPNRTIYVPDPLTGWTYRPKATFFDGLFKINGASMRATRDYSPQPAADTLRIALFGDSFVAGSEVGNEEVWGYQLETLLTEAGLEAEALNFGVAGYGMGQAFLRWQSQGKGFAPDVVIFAFQPENLDRNVNIFRLLYLQGGIVYSKPRFILEGDKLALINSPALPPEEIMDVFENFDSHPLAIHEGYYRGRDAASPLWKLSKLAGFAYAALERRFPPAPNANEYGPEGERGKLAQAIVDAFAADVADSGVAFIVLHLPRKEKLKDFHDGKRQPYQFLLDHFRQAHHFINAEDFLGEQYTQDAYYQPRGHYGPEIHLKIAEAVATELRVCIDKAACLSARFASIVDSGN